MSRIILTTDLSTESTAAFAPTVELAQKLGLPITLLTVVEDLEAIPHGAPLAPPQHDPEVTQQVESAKARLSEIKQELGSAVEVDTLVLTGEPIHQVICDHAAGSGAKFIAMTTHGRTGFRHLIVGSIAESIQRHTTVPTICFPGKAAE